MLLMVITIVTLTTKLINKKFSIKFILLLNLKDFKINSLFIKYFVNQNQYIPYLVKLDEV
jgi:hypothetical protein